jgi:hypothetical protein
MARVAVDVDDDTTNPKQAAQDVEGPETDEEAPRARRRKRPDVDPIEIEIEREVTKRHMIEAISSIVVVVLYMAFTLLRDRDPGVVVLDERDKGAADDWEE